MNLAFSMTTAQIRARTKSVTRRLGKGPRPGQRFWAIVKGQGLKKGEKVERICELECVSNTPERIDSLLDPYTATRNRREVDAEGFPELSPADLSGCVVVKREEWERLTAGRLNLAKLKERGITPNGDDGHFDA